MKRTILLTLALLALAGTAHAGVFGSVKNWLTGEITGALLSVAALGILGIAGYLAKKSDTGYNRVTQTLAETGEFIKALGDAAADRSVTRDELANIIRQGADVVNIYRTTPVQYQTGPGNPEPPRALVR